MKYRSRIEADAAKQLAYVRGCDRDGRALLVVHPRTSADTVDEDFILTQIYLVERAIAATEDSSLGRIEKISAVFDFGAFQSSLAPSLNAVKAVCGILQNRYSERLQKLIVTDPPFWMRTMWGIVKPFLDPVTSAKFIVASGSKRKQLIVSEVIDESQAMPFLIPTGKLTDDVDCGLFLGVVPFQCGYDAHKYLPRGDEGGEDDDNAGKENRNRHQRQQPVRDSFTRRTESFSSVSSMCSGTFDQFNGEVMVTTVTI